MLKIVRPPDPTADPAPTPPPLLTAGRVAGRLGVALHRVLYVLRTRGIRPAATAGTLRLFDEATVARVRRELDGIDARRPNGQGGTDAR